MFLVSLFSIMSMKFSSVKLSIRRTAWARNTTKVTKFCTCLLAVLTAACVAVALITGRLGRRPEVTHQWTGNEMSAGQIAGKNDHDSAQTKINKSVISPSAVNRTSTTSTWLFFTRLPRSAGGTMAILLQSLAHKLSFLHEEHQYRKPWQRLLTKEEQDSLVSWFEFYQWPTSYDRRTFYVNFSEHAKPYMKERPSYVSVVRDPVQKFVSYFHWKRTDKERARREMEFRDKLRPGDGRRWYSLSLEACVLHNEAECVLGRAENTFLSAVAFFCGQHQRCLSPGDPWALQRAKDTLERHYSVVGTVERWNDTLELLDRFVPRFFREAKRTYWSQDFLPKIVNQNLRAVTPASEVVLQILRDQLKDEMELYSFINQRMNLQKQAFYSRTNS